MKAQTDEESFNKRLQAAIAKKKKEKKLFKKEKLLRQLEKCNDEWAIGIM